MRAVILAAGEGKRLGRHFEAPKPLVNLLGLSLIERNILSLKECGIRDFVIITGCYEREIKEYLGEGERSGVNITYLNNPDWRLGNGVSARTFRRVYRPGEKFILTMADHIFEPTVTSDFVADPQKTGDDGILLAADRRLNEVYDVEECTKIRYERDLAVQTGKELTEYNAVDCGLFLCTGALLDALDETISQGRYALTDAVNKLAGEGRVRLHFVNGGWIDIDDIGAYRHAERILLRSLIPPKDGSVSRLFNRRFSLRITKVLSGTGITPDQITILSFLISALSAFFFTPARLFPVA
ncbi:MAG: phosphocholine cytidylyltransferase family protein [Methanoculleaceae archaeon]